MCSIQEHWLGRSHQQATLPELPPPATFDISLLKEPTSLTAFSAFRRAYSMKHIVLSIMSPTYFAHWLCLPTVALSTCRSKIIGILFSVRTTTLILFENSERLYQPTTHISHNSIKLEVRHVDRADCDEPCHLFTVSSRELHHLARIPSGRFLVFHCGNGALSDVYQVKCARSGCEAKRLDTIFI